MRLARRRAISRTYGETYGVFLDRGVAGEPEVGRMRSKGRARGQILEALDQIEHHDFQLCGAGVLEVLAYETRVGEKGIDGGVDVLAFPHAFGMSSLRIKVQSWTPTQHWRVRRSG
jgi:hypothetical protein